MDFDIHYLFKEQLNAVLEKSKADRKDIKWIGSNNGEYSCSWEEFTKRLVLLQLTSFYYDYINLESIYKTYYNTDNYLVLVADEWWVELHNNKDPYSDSYNWEFHRYPTLKPNTKHFKYLPGTLQIGLLEDGVKLTITKYTDDEDKSLIKMLDIVDKNNYVEEEVGYLEEYDISLEDIQQLKYKETVHELSSIK